MNISRILILSALVSVLVPGSEVAARPVSGSPAPVFDRIASDGENLTADGADLVILGTVTTLESSWDETSTAIKTRAGIDIEKVLLGEEQLQRVDVSVAGGKVGELTQSVSDSPEFRVNDKALLFLIRNDGGTYSPVGGRSGVFIGTAEKSGVGTDFSQLINLFNQGERNPLFSVASGSGVSEADSVMSMTTSETSEAVQSGNTGMVAAPAINGMLPVSGAAGTNTQVIINGRNLGEEQGESKLTFFYKIGEPRIEAPVYHWSDTKIITAIPVGTINAYNASASSGQVIISTGAGDSNAFPFAVTFSYQGEKWAGNSPAVHYRLNPDQSGDAGVQMAIQAAARTWSNVPGADFQYIYDGLTTVTEPSYNGVNEIMWGDLGAGGPLATASSWSDSGGNMREFDLVFNTSDVWSTSGEPGTHDIQTVATHELGHGLGLRDLYGEEGDPSDMAKMMYGRAKAGEIRRDLTEEDRKGIRWIYPVREAVVLGAGGFGPTAIGVNPNTSRVYVASEYGNNVLVIDSLTNEVISEIKVGNRPQGIAVNTETNRIYVANTFSDTISVIDGVTDCLISRIDVGSNPFRLEVNQFTNRIYVANYGSNTVSVIDGVTDSVITTVTVGGEPAGVGVNPVTNRVYVSNDADGTISIIDGITNNVINTINAGNGPGGIAVNPDKNRIYVANFGSNSISVIDGQTLDVAELSTGSGPRGVAVDISANRVFVANYNDNNISVIDGITGGVTATVTVGNKPFGISVNSITNRIYVANNGSNDVSVIDTATFTGVLEVPTASGPDALEVNAGNGLLYVANYPTNSLVVIDGATGAKLSTLNVGRGPAGVGVNPGTNRIYVANSGAGQVEVIDGENLTILTTVNVGSRPTGVAVNPVINRIYVTNNSSGTLSVIDGNTDSLLTTVNVGTLPIGVAVNHVTGRIYVANNYDDSVSVIEGAGNTVIAQVDVGKWPFGIGVNTTTNRIYIANNGDDTVSVIDGAHNSLLSTIHVGEAPRSIGVNFSSGRIMVTNNGENSLSVIDGWGNMVVATQNVGQSPRGVTVEPLSGRIYVADYGTDDVTIYQDLTPARGDANEDKALDMGDVTKLMRIILGLDTLSESADANWDGLIDLGDATRIMRRILGID